MTNGLTIENELTWQNWLSAGAEAVTDVDDYNVGGCPHWDRPGADKQGDDMEQVWKMPGE